MPSNAERYFTLKTFTTFKKLLFKSRKDLPLSTQRWGSLLVGLYIKLHFTSVRTNVCFVLYKRNISAVISSILIHQCKYGRFVNVSKILPNEYTTKEYKNISIGIISNTNTLSKETFQSPIRCSPRENIIYDLTYYHQINRAWKRKLINNYIQILYLKNVCQLYLPSELTNNIISYVHRYTLYKTYSPWVKSFIDYKYLEFTTKKEIIPIQKSISPHFNPLEIMIGRLISLGLVTPWDTLTKQFQSVIRSCTYIPPISNSPFGTPPDKWGYPEDIFVGDTLSGKSYSKGYYLVDLSIKQNKTNTMIMKSLRSAFILQPITHTFIEPFFTLLIYDQRKTGRSDKHIQNLLKLLYNNPTIPRNSIYRNDIIGEWYMELIG